MDLASLIAADRIVLDLSVSDKNRLLQELSQKAAHALALEPRTVLNAIMTRERLGSTGLGAGAAIPHARLSELGAPYVLFARLARPLDYKAIDGAPVDLLFFVLLPHGKDRENLSLLAGIAKRLRTEEFKAALRAAVGDEDVRRAVASTQTKPGAPA
jgi:PTS system nitrogen regulatory IIA component